MDPNYKIVLPWIPPNSQVLTHYTALLLTTHRCYDGYLLYYHSFERLGAGEAPAAVIDLRRVTGSISV
jgi:hypothetical protein